MSSAAVVIGALRVKKKITPSSELSNYSLFGGHL